MEEESGAPGKEKQQTVFRNVGDVTSIRRLSTQLRTVTNIEFNA